MTKSERRAHTKLLFEYITSKELPFGVIYDSPPKNLIDFTSKLRAAPGGGLSPVVFRGACADIPLVRKMAEGALKYLKKIGEAEKALNHRYYTGSKPKANGIVPLSDTTYQSRISKFCEEFEKGGPKAGYLYGFHQEISSYGAKISYSPIEKHVKDGDTEPPMCSDVEGIKQYKDWYLAFLRYYIPDRDLHKFTSSQYFLTAGEARTPLHYDSHYIMYVCTHGQRRWKIAPPWLTPQLRDKNARESNYSTYDAFGKEGTGDLISYPFFDVTMEPGDILFLPPACWHQVASIPDDTTRLSSAFNFVVEIEDLELKNKFEAVEKQFNGATQAIENSLKPRNVPSSDELKTWIAGRIID
jgi:hypothetical protein